MPGNDDPGNDDPGNDDPGNDDMHALLVAYADGELDEALVAEVEAHLAANPAAQRTLAIYRETAALLRAAFPESRYAAGDVPETIRKTATPPKLRRPRLPRYTWAVAASLAMAMLGYATGARWPGLIESERDRMLDEVAEYHSIYSRETVHLVEVPATQEAHLKAWLGKRVNATLVIPNFNQDGLTFAGGRLVVLEGEPVAELMYTRPTGLPIAFCVLYHVGQPSTITVERRGDLNLATWNDGSHSYFVVGDADQAMIHGLATQAREQL
jgi:anti-sigma factor RsiW